MAYGERFRFTFRAENGTDYSIRIYEKDFQGTWVSRPLGGSPVLRMDQSGCIRGTSLEIKAECSVNNEFGILYTSDPFRFKVELLCGTSQVWWGYVSPELYSEPDIAPPYDVSITAVDGLGELKRDLYTREGDVTLRALLTGILSHTGSNLGIMLSSSLRLSGGSAASMLDSVKVNFEHMAGQTLYDVLQAVLTSMHATITRLGNTWLIMRETDVITNVVEGGVSAWLNSDSLTIPVPAVTSMSEGPWWPVGQLSSERVPAENSVVVKSDGHPIELLTNPDFDGSDGWEHPNVGFSDGEAILPSDASSYLMQGRATLGQITDPLRLTVRAYPQRPNYMERCSLTVRFSRMMGNQQLFLKSDGTWTTTESSMLLDFGYPYQVVDSSNCSEVTIEVPLSQSDYATHLSIMVSNSSGATFHIRQLRLSTADAISGDFEIRSNIGNGARNPSSDVSMAFAYISGPSSRVLPLLSGVLKPASGSYTTPLFVTDRITTARNLMYQMALDYAMSCADSRWRYSGVLNVPAGQTFAPLIIRKGGNYHTVESYSWSLYDAELEARMTEVPVAIVEANFSGRGGYSQSQSAPGKADKAEVEAIGSDISAHVNNTSIHVSGTEKAKWNAMLPKDIWDDVFEIDGTLLKVKNGRSLRVDGSLAIGAAEGGGGGGGTGNVMGIKFGSDPQITTTTGLLEVTSIPSDVVRGFSAVESNASLGAEAYSWGNHAGAGYAYASALGNYLPTSGGVLSNPVFASQLTINRQQTGGDSVIKYAVNGSTVGYMGFHSDGTPCVYGTDASGSGYTIITTSNIGSQSVAYAGNSGTLGGLSEARFFRKNLIYDSADCNTMEANSFTILNRDAGSLTCSNHPTEASIAGGYGVLTVKHGAYGNQIFFPYSNAAIYLRAQSFNGNTGSIIWGDWFKVYHSGNSNKTDVDWNCNDLIAAGVVKGNGLKSNFICIECNKDGAKGNGSEINNFDGTLYLQYATAHNLSLCYGGGKTIIGTATTGLAKLHIDSSTSREAIAVNSTHTYGPLINLYHNGTLCGAVCSSAGGTFLIDRTSGKEIDILADGTGYINTTAFGVGTTTPKSKLHIVGESRFTNGGSGSTTIDRANSAIIIGPSAARITVANRYYAGIGFNQLLNYDNPGSYDYTINAWIGTRYYDALGSERSYLVFATKEGTSTEGAIERMCIDPFGNVGVGTTTPSDKFHVAGNILVTGALNIGVASDARLKDNVARITDAASVLRSLRGVEYDWNETATSLYSSLKGHDVGMIAQEVERYIPSAISPIFESYKRLDYTKVVPYLVEGWQEHDDEIVKLKERVKELERELARLAS